MTGPSQSDLSPHLWSPPFPPESKYFQGIFQGWRRCHRLLGQKIAARRAEERSSCTNPQNVQNQNKPGLGWVGAVSAIRWSHLPALGSSHPLASHCVLAEAGLIQSSWETTFSFDHLRTWKCMKMETIMTGTKMGSKAASPLKIKEWKEDIKARLWMWVRLQWGMVQGAGDTRGQVTGEWRCQLPVWSPQSGLTVTVQQCSV